jgi:hypothetical protein
MTDYQFQYDGIPTHFVIIVQEFFSDVFQDNWIVCCLQLMCILDCSLCSFIVVYETERWYRYNPAQLRNWTSSPKYF